MAGDIHSKEKDLLLQSVIDIVEAAGKAIMEVYRTKFTIKYKQDKSPVTMADERSHSIITAGLQQISSYPILSEEMEQPSYEVRKKWKAFWLVDPLDGTKEFINRRDEFTVNIALIKDTAPILGVIYSPVQKTAYYALKGRGAFRITGKHGPDLSAKQEENLNYNRTKLPISKRTSNIYTIVASRSHLSNATDNYIKNEKSKYVEVRAIYAGSSLKFCRVAEGAADAYPRFEPTMEWDTAAGQIIVEESGKRMVLSDGITPLSYNKRSLTNPVFLVF